jgi:hypothetical protein
MGDEWVVDSKEIGSVEVSTLQSWLAEGMKTTTTTT